MKYLSLVLLLLAACSAQSANRANIVFGNGNPEDWGKQPWEFSCGDRYELDEDYRFNLINCMLPGIECYTSDKLETGEQIYWCGKHTLKWELDESGLDKATWYYENEEASKDVAVGHIRSLSSDTFEVHAGDETTYCVMRDNALRHCQMSPE
jgi:hypothetical protein